MEFIQKIKRRRKVVNFISKNKVKTHLNVIRWLVFIFMVSVVLLETHKLSITSRKCLC